MANLNLNSKASGTINCRDLDIAQMKLPHVTSDCLLVFSPVTSVANLKSDAEPYIETQLGTVVR